MCLLFIFYRVPFSSGAVTPGCDGALFILTRFVGSRRNLSSAIHLAVWRRRISDEFRKAMTYAEACVNTLTNVDSVLRFVVLGDESERLREPMKCKVQVNHEVIGPRKQSRKKKGTIRYELVQRHGEMMVRVVGRR